MTYLKTLRENNFIILDFFFVILILAFFFQAYTLTKIIGQTSKLEIIKFEIKSNKAIEESQKQYLEIKEKVTELNSDIKRIETVNDKRFEIMGWSLGLILTVFGAFLALSYINSKASIRDFVVDELQEKNTSFNKLYDEIMDKMTANYAQINAEIEAFKNQKKPSKKE